MRLASSGFTLVEMVTVIVLLAIVALSITSVVRTGAQAFVDTSRRDELQQVARFAVERLSREVRNALPRSIRVDLSGTCLEFVPVEAGSSYINTVADAEYTTLSAVDFGYPTGAATDRRVVVYPVDDTEVYIEDTTVAVPPSGLATYAVKELASVSAAVSDIQTLTFGNLASVSGHRYLNESPTQRFFIVSEPVSFCVSGNELRRHSAYGWQASQPTTVADLGVGVLVAEFISTTDGGTPFVFASGTTSRSGVVSLDFRFNDTRGSGGDEWVRMRHEVFVRNTP